MSDTKYNGWINYETWCVQNALNNQEGTYRCWIDQAAEVWENSEAEGIFTRSTVAMHELADRLKEAVSDDRPVGPQGSLYNDLLMSALNKVDWHEIANGWLSETPTTEHYQALDKEEEDEEDE